MGFVTKRECKDKDVVDFIESVEMVSEELYQVVVKHGKIYQKNVLISAIVDLFLIAMDSIDQETKAELLSAILEKMETEKDESEDG